MDWSDVERAQHRLARSISDLVAGKLAPRPGNHTGARYVLLRGACGRSRVSDQYLDAGAATRTAGPVPRRWPSGLGERPALAVSGAAAVVLLGGAVAVLSGHPPGTTEAGNGVALAGVSGCTALGQASGTLARVNGGNLVIRTASGKLVTVTTTAATRIAVSRAPLRAITDGAPIVVAGPSSGGIITAARVAVGGKAALAALPGTVVVQGMVADAGPAGFTVVTSTGSQIPVTTSSGTSVTVLPANLDQLRAGANTIAVGHSGPGKTMPAAAVFQPPTTPPGAHATVTVGDCSPSSVDRAVMALTATG
jgi:hypothetical protein